MTSAAGLESCPTANAGGKTGQEACPTIRATGITAYLKNGGKLEVALQMAAHESARTTGLYDRRNDAVELDESRAGGVLKS